jgi:hypothetical protein
VPRRRARPQPSLHRPLFSVHTAREEQWVSPSVHSRPSLRMRSPVTTPAIADRGLLTVPGGTDNCPAPVDIDHRASARHPSTCAPIPPAGRVAAVFGSLPSSRGVPDLFPPPAVKVPAPCCLCGDGRWSAEAAVGSHGRRAASGLRTGASQVSPKGRREGSDFGRRGGPRSDRAASETATGVTAPGHLMGGALGGSGRGPSARSQAARVRDEVSADPLRSGFRKPARGERARPST